ncbi:hypothetical protein SAMN06273567_101337 [Geodermatophilus aquaeductus]|uniref:Uncharacterized protein n=1 Tax=Geodermatophilus aquaeductus TaxID=1564161 RepID=A0A521ATF6_9ACTN|nr:hypothetical protein [Geodermatophilus aquaeductus]SMO38148.1 hypothetical protein SAMN06273567_101337 [Geodermatophilus aquaeductus]
MQTAGRTAPAGRWVAEAVRAAPPDTVAALVPARFPAYARVFHPAVRYDGDDDVFVRWDEVAAANGTTAHRLMQWPGITGSWDHLGEADQPGLWNDAPAEGHLVAHVARELATVLEDQTTTPGECWFGWDDGGAADLPRLCLPRADLLLTRGPVERAATNFAPEPREQSAALWWPADRAWCVVTDPALTSTYVGGAVATVDALLATRLEVAPAGPGDPVTPDSDPVNPVLSHA